MKTNEVLIKAADLIVERGHGKGTYVSKGGEVCALGAIMITCGASVAPSWLFEDGFKLIHQGRTPDEYNSSEAARNKLREYLYARAEESGWDRHSDSIPSWNDRSDSETVVKAMREAAMEEKN